MISYLRVSITEKCNLRCVYCRPDNTPFKYNDDMLTYSEISRLVKMMTKFGLTKVRITGGEPLVRPNVDKLIKMLREIPKIEDISLTTNGITLKKHAKKLKDAGLNRLNISIDSLKEDKFFEITRGRLKEVLEGIKEAKNLGIEPIKINAVVMKNINDDEVLDFLKFAKDYEVEIRFIEMMPIGTEFIDLSMNNLLYLDKIKNIIEKKYGKLIPTYSKGSGAAKVYKIPSINVKVGFITPMSSPFCDGCSKLRLTVNGSIKLCLRTDEEIPARDIIRNGSDKELEEFLKKVIVEKQISNLKVIQSGYQFNECSRTSMVSIGG